MAGTPGDGTNIEDLIEYDDDTAIVSPLDWNKLIKHLKIMKNEIISLQSTVISLEARVQDLENPP